VVGDRGLTGLVADGSADWRGTVLARSFRRHEAGGHTAYLDMLGGTIRRQLAQRTGGLRLLHTNRHQMKAVVRTGHAHLSVSACDVIPDDLITTPVASYLKFCLIPIGNDSLANAPPGWPTKPAPNGSSAAEPAARDQPGTGARDRSHPLVS
jgi:hypothetical protein